MNYSIRPAGRRKRNVLLLISYLFVKTLRPKCWSLNIFRCRIGSHAKLLQLRLNAVYAGGVRKYETCQHGSAREILG